jgi:MFS family permease
MVPPTFGTLAKKFHVTNQQASYFTTVYILFTGVVPLLVTPFVNIYGRRPAYLVRQPSSLLQNFSLMRGN